MQTSQIFYREPIFYWAVLYVEKGRCILEYHAMIGILLMNQELCLLTICEKSSSLVIDDPHRTFVRSSLLFA
jgi:hypothetical protein